MKIPLVVAVIASAFSFAQPNFAQQKETVDAQIVQLIVAHQKIYDEAFNNGDAAALTTKMFTEDAVLVTDSGPIYGREAIEKHFADMFKQVHFSNFSGEKTLTDKIERCTFPQWDGGGGTVNIAFPTENEFQSTVAKPLSDPKMGPFVPHMN